MRTFLILLIAALLPEGLQALPTPSDVALDNDATPELEHRIRSLDSKLEKLARLGMRSGAGSVGCQSAYHLDPNHTEWVQVDLGQPTPIDQLVVVPIVWRDSKTGFDANGFPKELQILAGTDADSEGILIASFAESDQLTPRVAPLVVPCATTASWVRVQASVLSQGNLGTRYSFELAELMVFNGQENVALRKPVTSSSVSPRDGGSRKNEYLVDGFVPYIMDSGRGKKQIPYLSSHQASGDPPSVLIDLGAVHPINRIHIHPFDASDSVPQPVISGHALPNWFVVEGANQADFSDARQLIVYRKNTFYDLGPMIMRNVPETPCRYVRLTALELFNPYKRDTADLGFAEIEVFSEGRNVALNKPVEVSPRNWGRPVPHLTDGLNVYGEILPIRQWMSELALRHDLERERPRLIAEISQRYAHQKTTMQRLGWLVNLLAVGIVLTFLIDRIFSMRRITKVRESLAADLHDELGANIHTMGMLGELARDVESHDELIELLDRSRIYTDRSASAVRHASNMLEGHDLCKDLKNDLQRCFERLLGDMDYDLSFEGEEHLSTLKPAKRIGLFLFCKESLINIIRHAGATRVDAQVITTARQLTIRITDNGIGLSDGIPASLKRRARLLGAQVTTDRPQEGGSCIILNLQLKRWRLGP